MGGLFWREWGDRLLECIYPCACVSCGAAVEESPFRHLCRACAEKIERVKEPSCPSCGSPIYGASEEGRICEHCFGLRPEYREGATVALAKGPLRALIHELKYHRGRFWAEDAARLVRGSERVCRLIRGAVLVPVPLHPRKERQRGYNQSRWLAEALVRAVEGEGTVADLLVRVQDTQTQTFFDRESRRLNLKNAFALRPGAVIKTDLHYVLVDDVFTTGSTLNSCAGVLRRAGVLNLDVVTLGHG